MTPALDIPRRAESIERTFAAAFAALEDLAKHSPGDADRIAAIIVAHVRSSRPQALRADIESAPFVRVDLARPDPSPTALSREISDSCWYEVAREGDRVRLYLHEGAGHDAAALLTPVQAFRLRADIDEVGGMITRVP